MTAGRELWSLLRRSHDFRCLVSAGLVSLTGDWMLRVGLTFYVYDLTGSTLASAGTMLASFLPRILLSSVAGVFVDRWDRLRTIVVSNLLMAVGLLPLLLVDRPDHVWIVYAVTAYEGTIELFSVPAEQAMVPRLVTDDQLVTANALNGQVREISRLTGSAIGGVLVAAGGVTALTLVDAATFLAAAALVARIETGGRVDLDMPAAHHTAPALVSPYRLGRMAHEWGEGLRTAVSEPALRAVFAFTLIVMTGEGVMGTLFAPFVRDVLHGGPRAYGLVTAVQAVGGIAGGFVAAALGHRFSPALMFGGGAILFGLVDLLMFVYPLVYVALWPAVACMVVVGVPGALAMAGYATLLQRHTTDAFRGRVFGALGAVQGVAILAGTVTAGLLAERVPIVPVIAVQGVGGMVAGLLVLAILRAELRATSLRPVAVPAE